MMAPHKVAWASLLLGSVFALQVVLAGVQTDSIDLSKFKLRHVDTQSMTRQRAGQGINDLATGALHMRESLFVDCNYIKCPAYAHLFKVIKHQQQRADSEFQNPIKQGTIESLALVVTYDRIFYHKIFVDNAQRVSANHFIEALNLLEADSNNEASNRDTWLDLAACLTVYMSAGNDKKSAKRVQLFLREPKRASALAALKKFKLIPVDVEGEQTPRGLVPNLARKFDNGRAPNRLDRFFGSLFGKGAISNSLDDRDTSIKSGKVKHLCADIEGKFEPGDNMVPGSRLNPDQKQNLDEARGLIESLDDEQTAKARRQFAANPSEAAKEMTKLVSEAGKEGKALEAAAKEAAKVVGDAAIANRPVELIVPTEDVEALFADSESSDGANSDAEAESEVGAGDGDRDTLSSSSSFSSPGGWDDRSSFGDDDDAETETETARRGLGGPEGLADPDSTNAGSSLKGLQGSGEHDGKLSSASAASTVKQADPIRAAVSLALLKFVKLRLEAERPTRYDKPPALSINLALNFANHWRDLNDALPSIDTDKYGDFVGRARKFLDSEESQKVADRIRVALESYSEIVALVEEIVQEKQYKSIEEFKRPFERLTSLLKTMDRSFDVDDLRRFHVVWRRKYQETTTMSNFIDFGFGR